MRINVASLDKQELTDEVISKILSKYPKSI